MNPRRFLNILRSPSGALILFILGLAIVLWLVNSRSDSSGSSGDTTTATPTPKPGKGQQLTQTVERGMSPFNPPQPSSTPPRTMYSMPSVARRKAQRIRQPCVREEYMKIWNSDVMKAGGTPSITDFETEAVLQGESGSAGWKRKAFAKAGSNPLSTLSNQLVQSIGMFGTVWARNDGAEARLTLGKSSIVLELPQAVKYDAEMKAIKDARARSNVPKF